MEKCSNKGQVKSFESIYLGERTKISKRLLYNNREIDTFKDFTSIFSDRMGLVLANLDASLNLTGCIAAKIYPRCNVEFSYNIVNATIGSIAYFQYRSYLSEGSAIIKNSTGICSMDRITYFTSLENMGLCSLSIYLLPLDNKLDMNEIRYLSMLTAENGDFLIQVPFNVSLEDINTLQAISTNYRLMLMCRPLSLEPESGTFFLLFRAKFYSPNQYGDIPEERKLMLEFMTKIENAEELFTSWIINGMNKIIKLLASFEEERVWSLYTCLVFWNIPDTRVLEE